MNLVYAAVAIALAAAVLALWLAAWWRGWRGSRRARRRAVRAMAGEEDAVALLEQEGYRVTARQARLLWPVVVDGEAFDVELRADYLVERDGELLVAEVKTGEAAPRLDTAATRRQLLEYRVAFGADAVLLVCPERGVIHRVDFAIAGRAAENLPAFTPSRTLGA